MCYSAQFPRRALNLTYSFASKIDDSSDPAGLQKGMWFFLITILFIFNNQRRGLKNMLKT